jgi:hypothetical protein
MAATISLYNHTAARFASGTFLPSHTYKVALLNGSATFVATHDEFADVSAYQVSGYGWTSGGVALTSVVVETATTNDAKFDAADVLVNITGGDLGPFQAYVIYNDTLSGDPLVAYIQLSSGQSVSDGNTAGIVWNASGIITWTVT